MLYKETTFEKISRMEFLITLAIQLCGDEFKDNNLQKNMSKKPYELSKILQKKKNCSFEHHIS